jgi:uncharacterized protein YlbG (UPF0298 family)
MKKGVAIYFKDQSVLSRLDTKIIDIYYVSLKAHYAVLYVDKKNFDYVVSEFRKNNLITDVLTSEIPYEKYAF